MPLKAVLDTPYRTQMADHLIRLSDDLQRQRGWAATGSDWEARRPAVREALTAGLGIPDERPPLASRTLAVLPRDGYRIELVEFFSRPGCRVTGALYLPAEPGVYPGVICPHGHWPEGRLTPTVYARGIGLARRGYVTLLLDKLGYQDRADQGPHGTREGLLAGITTQGLLLHDNLRGVDYLLSRPEVLPDRIGCTGCSGGGNQTMYLAALDPRITAAAPVCSVELGECYMHKRFCTCELVPGLRTFADLVDVCGLVAPRALLLVHGLLDRGFRIDSARKAAARIHDIYDAVDASDRFDSFTSLDAHNYNQEMREAVYGWFDRHLKGLPAAKAVESPWQEEPDSAVLRCGAADQSSPRYTLNAVYQSATAQLPPRPPVQGRDDWLAEAARLRHAVAGLFGGWPTLSPLRLHWLDAEPQAWTAAPTATSRRLYFFSEPDVVVPGVWYKPGRPTATAVVRTGTDGQRSVDDSRIAGDLAVGRAVLAIDPRGTGDTRADDPHSDWQAYLSSVTLGRHFLAMRAWDLRRAADLALTELGCQTVHLATSGGLLSGLAGLLAAACDRRFASYATESLLPTYRGWSDFGELSGEGQLAVIPNLLTVADVPDLLGLISPRPVKVERFVGPLGQPVAADDLTTSRYDTVAAWLGAPPASEWPS